MQQPKYLGDIIRFMKRIRKRAAPANAPVKGPCWIWQGKLKDGYGRFDFDGVTQRAHRVGYMLFVGPIPPGVVLDHVCRVRKCANPQHVEPVTQRENIMRGSNHVAIRARTTHCPAGHAYDEANTYRDKKNRRYCRACRRARGSARAA